MPRVRLDVTGQILLDWIESHADSNGIVEAGRSVARQSAGEARRDGSECAGQAPEAWQGLNPRGQF
jgi:hypothetical protein